MQGHLAPFLPTHPLHPTGAMPGFKSDDKSFGAMAAAPYGSSLILPISYAYISMMGSDGLTEVRPVILEACPAPCCPGALSSHTAGRVPTCRSGFLAGWPAGAHGRAEREVDAFAWRGLRCTVFAKDPSTL